MHVRIDRIESNPDDFKVCTECGHINWYENDRCVMCGGNRFRSLREKDISAIRAIYGNGEIDV